MPETPAAPPAGGRPQEAATPVEALAAEWEALADSIERDLAKNWDANDLGHCGRLRACALDVRDLAPAWDALAAENERLRALAAEVIAAYVSQVSYDETPHDRSRVAGWRKRAGLEARDA